MRIGFIFRIVTICNPTRFRIVDIGNQISVGLVVWLVIIGILSNRLYAGDRVGILRIQKTEA
jgi:hypothetical protein